MVECMPVRNVLRVALGSGCWGGLPAVVGVDLIISVVAGTVAIIIGFSSGDCAMSLVVPVRDAWEVAFSSG